MARRLTAKTPAWHAARRKGIGGSDAAAILGVDPYRKPIDVYNSKLNLVGPEPMNAAMKRGTYLEPIAATLFSTLTKRKLKTTATIAHRSYPWMLANVDRLQLLRGEEELTFSVAPLEIKCPGFRAFTAMKHQGLPVHYIVQMQHYLEVGDWARGTFALFNAEFWEMIFFDIERDAEFGQQLIAAEQAFWTQHVLKQIPPPDVDAPTVNLPKSVKGDTIVRNDPDWVQAADQYREAEKLSEQAEGLIENAKDALKGLMGGYGAVEGGGIRVHYRQAPGRKTFDKERLAAEHPELDLKKYDKNGAPFDEFRVYAVKRGVGD